MSIGSVVEHQRIWFEGLNRGDASAGDSAFAPDCVVHITGIAEPFRGVGPWKDFIAGFLRAFPDIHFTVEDQLVQTDRVAFRWHATATHTGPLGAAPPTGKRVSLDGLIIDHLTNGKVRERWEQWDQPLMLQQLGFA
jgi:steroid delta-isomerase-like uncharacterized protein